MIVKATIDKRQRKDGTCAIKVSVHHGGQTRYITTDIHVRPNEFANGRIVKRTDSALLNGRLDKKLLSVNEAIGKIDYIECLNADELMLMIGEMSTIKNPTIEQCYNEWSKTLTCGDSSKKIYWQRYEALCGYLGKGFRLQETNAGVLTSAHAKMVRDGYSDNTIRMTMNTLRALLKFASDRDEIRLRESPFAKYKLPRVVAADNWMSVEEIRNFRDYETRSDWEKFTQDAFMLSYYLGGMNQADFLNMQFLSDKISFIRVKTKRQNRSKTRTEFAIHPKAMEIINRWKDENGYLKPPTACKFYSSMLNHQMKYFKRRHGGHYSFGAARKSVAQHLLDIGCPPMVIDYILAHSIQTDNKMLYRYVSVKPETATEWLWKVIDQL